MLLVLCFVVEVVGAILAWGVVVFIVATNRKRYRAAQRLGYELYAWIALMDWGNNVVGLFAYDNDLKYGAMSAVSLNPGVLKLGDLLQKNFNSAFVMLTVCMAFNLDMVFLRCRYLDTASHWRYARWAIGVPMLVPLPHLLLSLYTGRLSPLAAYWPPLGEVEQWIDHYVWQALGTGYCLYVFVAVVRRLRQNQIRLPNASTTVTVDRFASRLILYAVVPIVTQPPTFALRIFTTPTSLVLLILLSNLSATLNFVCFLFDPALVSIYREWRMRRYSLEPPPASPTHAHPLIWKM